MMKLIKSIGCAINGVRTVWREEVNFRIECGVALVVVAFGISLGFTKLEWAFVLVCVGAVLAAEILNTVVEDICEKIEPEMDPVIGKIKDMASGFVLLVAAVSAIIGIMVFTNHL